MLVDTSNLITRTAAAKMCFRTPVFSQNYIKLYLVEDVKRLDKIVPSAGRPKKVA
jgi:hypothetical protein